ncbi:SDR family oxidoreductase [candidate division KSB1 bacterium]|nr:SDR family oxidoreductase [candidate division KSB1 bacterium]
MNGLTGKVALITGSSRGLGRGMAMVLAEKGVRVIINYSTNSRNARDTVEEIRAKGLQAVEIQGDVREWRQVRALVKKAAAEWGQLDFLINNVGDFVYKKFNDIRIDDWNNMINSNLTSCFYCCKAVLPVMRKQKYGRIINIGLANAGIKAYQNVVPYAIAKTGVHILTKSLAVSEAEYGITVNVVAPGLMDNGSLSEKEIRDMGRAVPKQRTGTADDLAGAVLYLLSDNANYVTGTEIIVSGGWGL